MSEDSLTLIAEIKQYKETHKIEFYQPYDYQKKFHFAKGGGTFVPMNSDKDKVGLAILRALQCANQVGKCLSISTIIETDKGPRKIGDVFGKECNVLTWPDREQRKVKKWIRKAPEECFRITMENGEWVEVPSGHFILTDEGFSSVSSILKRLPGSVFYLQETNSAFSRLIHASGVLNCMRNIRDYLDDCSLGYRLGDAQLLSDEENVQVFAPLQDDALKHNSISSYLGGLANRCKHNLLRFFYRPSSSYAGLQTLGQCASTSGQAFSFHSLFENENIENARQFSNVGYRSQSLNEGQIFQSSSSVIPVIEGNKIVSVYSVGVKQLYDMEVEERHNYIAGGLIHHNSTCGGYETAIHLTGRYPDWWEGHRFGHPVEFLCSSNTNETTRDRCQRELFGDPADKADIGKGAIPKEDIMKDDLTRKAGVPDALEFALVKHHTNGVYDGKSKVYFKSYDQGPKKFQGYRLDGFWDDEEPPRDVLSQQQRSTLSTDGIGYMTYTPEEGVTEVVHEVIHDPKPGWALITATWDDAPHMTPNKRKQKLEQYPIHEREMRSRGIPMVGTGLVWPVNEEQLICPAFDIPSYFFRICAIDFGWDHPFASVWLAKDRDKGIIYLYDCYRQSQALIPVQASAIKSRGDWIPVVWPHDGMKHDPKSGKPMADLFRHEGVNMWREPFSNPPAPGQKEGQGGNGVEVGIQEILTLMETGRFKVFPHMKEWFDEWRMYHRKDGEIVKLRDDLMSATRYGVMMLRHAQTKPVAARKQNTYAGLSNWNG